MAWNTPRLPKQIFLEHGSKKSLRDPEKLWAWPLKMHLMHFCLFSWQRPRRSFVATTGGHSISGRGPNVFYSSWWKHSFFYSDERYFFRCWRILLVGVQNKSRKWIRVQRITLSSSLGIDLVYIWLSAKVLSQSSFVLLPSSCGHNFIASISTSLCKRLRNNLQL